jgi:DNA-binding MarR family transcriptional regulator
MTDFSTISKSDYVILAEFRYALRQYIQFSKHVVEITGITIQQHQALLAIIGYPGREKVTIGELAERMQIKHHSAVGLVNRLVEQELVQRTANQDDKRQVFISLTQKGIRVLDSLANLHREELRHLAPQLCVLLEQISQLVDK